VNTADKSLGREFALKYLYQCEIEKIFYFSASHFDNFALHFIDSAEVKVFSQKLAQTTFEHLATIDQSIEQTSSHWSFARITVIDKCVLRIAVCELLKFDTPSKVVINEAIELAKRFSSDQSGKFVNGILDTLAQKILKDHNNR
jgi:transcription antitermination factor NusB